MPFELGLCVADASRREGQKPERPDVGGQVAQSLGVAVLLVGLVDPAVVPVVQQLLPARGRGERGRRARHTGGKRECDRDHEQTGKLAAESQWGAVFSFS